MGVISGGDIIYYTSNPGYGYSRSTTSGGKFDAKLGELRFTVQVAPEDCTGSPAPRVSANTAATRSRSEPVPGVSSPERNRIVTTATRVLGLPASGDGPRGDPRLPEEAVFEVDAARHQRRGVTFEGGEWFDVPEALVSGIYGGRRRMS